MSIPQIDVQPISEQLAPMPSHVLLDVARNPSSSREWRKAAVKMLLEKGYPQANHPDLAFLVQELKHERVAEAEVEAVVEAAIEQEMPGALQASVTTESLMQAPEIIRNADKLGEDALGEE